MEDKRVPSVGRVVHYVEDGSNRCSAAIVTEVHHPGECDSVLSLYVMAPFNSYHTEGVYRSQTPEQNCWHWPEYVPNKD